MARKRRAPSPSPPLQEEVEADGPPQGPPQPRPSPAAAGEDSDSDQDAGAQASQMRCPVSKPAADEEEDGGSAELEPKKAAAPNKKMPAPDPGRSGKSKKAAKAEALANKAETAAPNKTMPAPDPGRSGKSKKAAKAEALPNKAAKAEALPNKAETAAPNKTMPAPDPGRSGKSKKAAKAEVGKLGPEATPTGKGKKKTKAKAEQEKGAPGPAASGNANKSKVKLGESAKAKAEQEKGTPGPAASGNANKSKVKLGESAKAKAPRSWSDKDNMLILETLAEHVKAEGAQKKVQAISLLEAIGERLDRKDCTVTEMTDKVRSLARRYNSIAADPAKMPSDGAGLRMYNLSKEIWGQEAQLAAAAASQNDSSVTKSNKGLANKRNGNSKGGTVKEVAIRNIDTQKGSNKRNGNGNSKRGTVKEVHIPNIDTQKGSNSDHAAEVETDRNVTSKLSKKKGALVNDKGERTNRKASTSNGNGGTETEKENHEDDAQIEASYRSFDEMHNLYPQLAGYVQTIEPRHPCGETLKMAFGFISDEDAKALESEMEEQRKREADTLICRWEVQKGLVDLLLPYAPVASNLFWY